MSDDRHEETPRTADPSSETIDLHRQTRTNLDASEAPSAPPVDLPAEPKMPERIGQYKINRAIASGGMGTVYEAEQENPKRTVALKVIKQGFAAPSALRRFEFESQLLARLRHPGIAQVYEAGTHRDEHGTVPYFAMEFVPDAKPIDAYADEKQLSSRHRLELFAQICDAIHHGHQKGIIHRDLKPANILIDPSGQPKIIDFGVARSTDADITLATMHTEAGQLVGTLQYMSPEQCQADPHDIDIRSDVYALGVVLYQLLTGKVPYDLTRVALFEATRVIREQRPLRLATLNRTLRGDTETIVLKALEKERERRYQSAADLAQDIRRYLNNEPISARPPSLVYQVRVFARRNKIAFGSVAALFVSLIVGFFVSTSMYFQAEEARAVAVEARALADLRRAEAEDVTKFLKSTLSSVDPAKALGREVTVKEMLDQTAETIGRAFPSNPVAEADLRMTIGETYRKLGKYAAAEPHLRRALELRKKRFGPRSAEVADALSWLGAVLEATGAYDEAAAVWTEALNIQETLLDDNARPVADTRNRLGVLLWRKGDYAAAEPLWRKTLAIRRAQFGEQHEEVAESLSNLGTLLKDKGDYDEAEALHRQALAMRRYLLSEVHPDVAESLNNLAALLTEKGDFAAAEQMFRETLSIHRKLHGKEHPDIARSLSNLGELVAKSGNYDEAERLVREAVAMQRKLVGEGQPDVGLMLTTLVEILLAKGEPAAAESTAREAVTVLTNTLPVGHWLTARTESILGECLVALDRLDEAEALLIAAHETIKQARGSTDNYTTNALQRLIRYYEKSGQSDKASAHRAQLPAKH